MLGCKTLNNGLGVNVESTGGAYRYDRQTGPSEPTLAYGWRWSSTFFLCWSRMTGVTCRSKYSREGFSIESGDGGFRLRITGYAQGDARIYAGDDNEDGVDTFVLRRVRPTLTGTVGRWASFTATSATRTS